MADGHDKNQPLGVSPNLKRSRAAFGGELLFGVGLKSISQMHCRSQKICDLG